MSNYCKIKYASVAYVKSLYNLDKSTKVGGNVLGNQVVW